MNISETEVPDILLSEPLVHANTGMRSRSRLSHAIIRNHRPTDHVSIRTFPTLYIIVSVVVQNHPQESIVVKFKKKHNHCSSSFPFDP